MKFPYLKQPNFLNPRKPWISRPVIPVTLISNDKAIKVLALVDSGADVSLFHASLGRELGIDIPSGRREIFRGISEGPAVDVHLHTIDLEVGGNRIAMEAGFAESTGVGAILGQAGFFENYHIKFERDKESIEIDPIHK